MGDLWFRDLSPSTHQELRRRAEQAGMSLQAYVAQLLERSVSTPTVVDWLRGLDELPRHADLSGADVVRALRDEIL